MFAGYEYLFSEKDLRLFMKGRTIKAIVPITEDDQPVEIKFTDGYTIKMKHKPRSLGKGTYSPYFTVEVIKPSGRLLLQEEIRLLNIKEGKAKDKKAKSKIDEKKLKAGVKAQKTLGLIALEVNKERRDKVEKKVKESKAKKDKRLSKEFQNLAKFLITGKATKKRKAKGVK